MGAMIMGRMPKSTLEKPQEPYIYKTLLGHGLAQVSEWNREWDRNYKRDREKILALIDAVGIPGRTYGKN